MSDTAEAEVKTGLKEFIEVKKFHDDVSINPADIQRAYIEQAGHYAYYAGLYLKAQRQTGNYKILRDTLAAKIDQEIRQVSLAAATKELEDNPKAKPERLTNDAITAKRNIDPRYIQAVKNYIDAEAIEQFIKNALNAFEQRRDMLISLGSTLREEMKGDLRMRGPANEIDTLRERASAALARQANQN